MTDTKEEFEAKIKALRRSEAWNSALLGAVIFVFGCLVGAIVLHLMFPVAV